MMLTQNSVMTKYNVLCINMFGVMSKATIIIIHIN